MLHLLSIIIKALEVKFCSCDHPERNQPCYLFSTICLFVKLDFLSENLKINNKWGTCVLYNNLVKSDRIIIHDSYDRIHGFLNTQ